MYVHISETTIGGFKERKNIRVLTSRKELSVVDRATKNCELDQGSSTLTVHNIRNQ